MLFANNVLRVEDVYALIGAAPRLAAIGWVNAILGGIFAAFASVLFFPTV